MAQTEVNHPVYVPEYIPDLTSCLVSLLAGEREESESEAVPGGAQLSVYGNIPFKLFIQVWRQFLSTSFISHLN